MDLAERLSVLEGNHDWQGLVDELEKGVAAETDAAERARLHLKLGRTLIGKLLQGVKALKHFQDAYKQNPQLVEALEEARGVYWILGKLNMVQKLLELELKAAGDTPKAAVLLLELGDVLCDAGDYERAASMYAKALTASRGGLEEASDALEDVQVDAAGYPQHVAILQRKASEISEAAKKARYLLRAARVMRRFAPADAFALIEEAYVADPTDRQAAALYEGALAD